MTAELSLRHLKAIHAEFAEGRAETAPEIGSAEMGEGDEIGRLKIESEETERQKIGSADGDLISWVRAYIDRGERKVEFNEKVTIRPIPAVGRGQSCRGSLRSRRRGRWPEERAARAERQTTQKSDEKQRTAEGIDQIDTEQVNGSGQLEMRSHEPHREHPHVRSVKGSERWSDMDSDSEGEQELYRALRNAYATLDPAASRSNSGRADQIDSVEIEPARSCESSRSSGEADFEYVEPIVQPCNSNNDFVLADFAVGSWNVQRLEPGLSVLGVAHPKPQTFRRLSRPAICGSVLPQECCASLVNSCAAASVGPRAKRRVVDISLSVGKGGALDLSPLLSTNATHVHKCESKHVCIAMLPHILACLGDTSDRCAGSSPL
jgi:hypothetical protein